MEIAVQVGHRQTEHSTLSAIKVGGFKGAGTIAKRDADERS
jgi:hypothetical protein